MQEILDKLDQMDKDIKQIKAMMIDTPDVHNFTALTNKMNEKIDSATKSIIEAIKSK